MSPIRFKSSARLRAAPDCEAAAFEAELYNEVERAVLPPRSGWYWRRLGSQGPWQGPFSIFGIAVTSARKAAAEGVRSRAEQLAKDQAFYNQGVNPDAIP